MSLVEQLIQASLSAPDDRREYALRILQGESGSALVGAGQRDTEPFLTLKDCAKRLGLSACSLWRWRVPGHELGGRPKFRISEIEAYLASDEFKRRADLLRELDRSRRKASNPVSGKRMSSRKKTTTTQEENDHGSTESAGE